jgi:hypothetical protein
MKLISLVLVVFVMIGCGTAPVEAKTTPVVSMISSPFIQVGTASTITIYGSNFANNSNVMLDGYTYSPSSRFGSTSLTFNVPTTTAVGSHRIQVKTANLTSNTVQLTVVTPLVISYGTIPVLYPNEAASIPFSASGGYGTYSWEVSGSVPPGMTINAVTGVLSGTPTKSGTYNMVITVHDQSGILYATNTLTLGFVNV